MSKRQVLLAIFVFLILAITWEILALYQVVPKFLLPRFSQVLSVLISDRDLLMWHLTTTLTEAILGLLISINLGFFLAFAMDGSRLLRDLVYPLVVISQSVPTIALAPLLILWFGLGILPKVILIVLVCFFPITMTLYKGLTHLDKDQLNLFRSLGASSWQMIRYFKLPAILPDFFSGLKVSASYAVISAVVAEWLGGESGLGVYMTRVRKTFSFDKMFAVIILISLFSLFLVIIIHLLDYYAFPYKRLTKGGQK